MPVYYGGHGASWRRASYRDFPVTSVTSLEPIARTRSVIKPVNLPYSLAGMGQDEPFLIGEKPLVRVDVDAWAYDPFTPIEGIYHDYFTGTDIPIAVEEKTNWMLLALLAGGAYLLARKKK